MPYYTYTTHAKTQRIPIQATRLIPLPAKRLSNGRVNEEDTNDTEDTKLAGHTQPTVKTVQRMAQKYMSLPLWGCDKNQPEHNQNQEPNITHMSHNCVLTKIDSCL